jgi:hypothetical protein
MVKALRDALEEWDEEATMQALSRLVPEYKKLNIGEPIAISGKPDGRATDSDRPATPKLSTAP